MVVESGMNFLPTFESSLYSAVGVAVVKLKVCELLKCGTTGY